MNFPSNDYINDLNLEFIETNSAGSNSPGDLALFKNSDFFDFDVFPSGIEETKLSLGLSQNQSQSASTNTDNFLNLEDFLPIKQEEESNPSYTPQISQSEKGVFFHTIDSIEDAETAAELDNLSQLIPKTNSSNTTLISQLETPEDDKRRRNTAASARFRIKKKLKEQQMEQKSRELNDKVLALQNRVKTLEMENKCLKNLILQQNEKKNNDLLDHIKKRSSSSFNFTT